MKKILFVLVLYSILATMATSVVFSQECKVVKEYGDGTFLVQVGDKSLLAISEQGEKDLIKLRRDYLDALKEIEVKTALLSDYEKVKAQYDTTLQQKNDYIAELEELVKVYKKLVGEYKKLKEPWLSVEAGVGATGTDPKPAAMVGLGIKAVRVWGFFQEDNFGGLVGASLPLW